MEQGLSFLEIASYGQAALHLPHLIMDLFLVSEIKRPKDGSMEIKFFDRLKALEKLGAGGEHETGAKQLFDAISNSSRAVNDRENGN